MKEPHGDRLMEQFFHLTTLLHRHQHWSRRQYGPAGDAHRGQGRVLAALKLKPETTQKELSYLLGIRAQSLGELLVKLEKSAYITRNPSQRDRRVTVICLTDAGRAAAEKNDGGESVFDCLEEVEQANLETYLQKLITALEQEENAAHSARRPGRGEGPENGRAHFPRRTEHGGFQADDGRRFDERAHGGTADWAHGPHGRPEGFSADVDILRGHGHGAHRRETVRGGAWDEDVIYACSEEDREE